MRERLEFSRLKALPSADSLRPGWVGLGRRVSITVCTRNMYDLLPRSLYPCGHLRLAAVLFVLVVLTREPRRPVESGGNFSAPLLNSVTRR